MHHASIYGTGNASSKIVLIKLVEIWQIEDTSSTVLYGNIKMIIIQVLYTVEPTIHIHQQAIFCCSGAFCVQNAPVELKLSLYI